VKSLEYIKCFEDFKLNNITVEDIIKCINSDGFIETDIVKDYVEKITGLVRPISVDDDGEITVEIDSRTYTVDLEDVKKIIY
jgi:hypothetical protein